MGQRARVASHRLRASKVDRVVVDEAWRLQVFLGIHLDVLDLERGVRAVEFVLGATSTLELAEALL